MRTRTRLLLAGASAAAVLAVGVPVALADGGPSSPTPAAPAACPHPVKDYLSAHPDVAAELKTLQALPADQRKAARQQWATAHPDLAAGLRAARREAGADAGVRLDVAADQLAAHPDVKALLDQLKSAPAGQRAQVARQYLAAHPGVRADLRALRTAVRSTC
jgi:hemophore-related protein